MSQALPHDPAQLERLVTLAMPFGRYQGRVIADLPGAYLARDGQDGNPGRNFIRVALVAAADQTEAALNRLKNFLYQGG